MAQNNDTMTTTNAFRKLNISEELNVKFSEVAQATTLAGRSTVNFISWNTMGSTRVGYARLRKNIFSLISRNSPTDIWLLQEPFSVVKTTLLLNMGLHELDPAVYQFLVESSYTSRQDACIVYNSRKFRCLQNANTLHQLVRQITSDNEMPYILASRLCAVLLQTVEGGAEIVTPTRFVAVSYHGIYRTSDSEKLVHIAHFHELCYLLCQHFRVPVVIGSDYNIDIHNELLRIDGFPAFLRIFNYAACRTRSNKVIFDLDSEARTYLDYEARTDVEKIDYFATVLHPRLLFLPLRCEALSVLTLQNQYPYTGHEYATEAEARELFEGFTPIPLPNLQLVSNHDPLYLSIDLHYRTDIFTELFR